MIARAARPLRVAVVGAGWAGLSAAVCAVQAGHDVTVYEAARITGGRARSLEVAGPAGDLLTVDNGQHILIGAYVQTLHLMQQVGVDPDTVFERRPLDLRFPDGRGLVLPKWPAPLDAAAGILAARGWPLADKLALLRTAARWQRQGFACDATLTVQALCAHLPPGVREGLIEPLCVSALNTPAAQASAAVFLRVLQDAMFSVSGGSHLLLPRVPLGALFPQAAAAWLQTRGAILRVGERVSSVAPVDGPGTRWQIGPDIFDRVVLACAPWDAARLAQAAAPAQADGWAALANALRFESIATVYALAKPAAADTRAAQHTLARPMIALRPAAGAPAQFAFDRGQLGGPHGLLAFVVSASNGERETLQAQVIAQARSQLGLNGLSALQTVIEKRATFACTPGLRRPGMNIAPGLLACGDYVDGPYPATLEGAVRSAQAAVLSPELA